MLMEKDALLENELALLKDVIDNIQNPNVKQCAQNVYDRINYLANFYYNSTDTTNEALYNETQAELHVLRQIATNTRCFINADNPSYLTAAAYKAFAIRTNDYISEQEKNVARLGIPVTTLLSILVALMQNIPANTNPKVKWVAIGIGSVSILGIAVATTFFIHGEKTQLKTLMMDLYNAVLKVIDPRYNRSDAVLHPESILRDTLFHSANENQSNEFKEKSERSVNTVEAQSNEYENELKDNANTTAHETKEQQVQEQDSDFGDSFISHDEQNSSIHVVR